LKHRINFILTLTILFNCNTNQLKAQGEYAPNFIGLNPSLTVEPFYYKGEMDISIIPVVYQRPLTKLFDIRLNSICNLGIRKNRNRISHIGVETALPIFLKKKENKNESSKGFYSTNFKPDKK